MAKQSKKAAAKKSTDNTSSKKNKFSINLGTVDLSNEERLEVLAAIHKAVATKIKTKAPKIDKKASIKTAPTKASAGLAAGDATITADFLDTEPGFSKLIATHKGNSKTITQSDKISFENVKAGDIIRVEVITLGKSEITIDRKAKPQEKKTADSSFRFLFEILE